MERWNTNKDDLCSPSLFRNGLFCVGDLEIKSFVDGMSHYSLFTAERASMGQKSIYQGKLTPG